MYLRKVMAGDIIRSVIMVSDLRITGLGGQ